MAAYAVHTTNKSTHFLTAQKTKTRATQKSLPGGLGKKRSGEWAKSRTEKDRKSKRTRQKYKRAEIEKIELTALRSRQGGDIGNPRPPFGGPTVHVVLTTIRKNSHYHDSFETQATIFTYNRHPLLPNEIESFKFCWRTHNMI